ncbi:hypothetical protein D3C79_696440 [compost metagenome]
MDFEKRMYNLSLLGEFEPIKNMKDLEDHFLFAHTHGKSVALVFYIPGCAAPELQINPHSNLHAKMTYIKDTYQHDLKHAHSSVKIIGALI